MRPKQQRRAWVKSRRVSDIVVLFDFGICDSNSPISSNLVLEKYMASQDSVYFSLQYL
jgi:hypothetical protein